MRSSKSRSRSKQNRPRTLGNIINRVFDSSGPEGKVRGTPQQIIEKYQMLARDAQLSNDRVAAENFLQHAEHYTRLLAEAMREQAAEQEARQQYQGQPGNGNGNGNGNSNGNGNRDRNDRGDYRSDQPDIGGGYAPAAQGFDVVGDEDGQLVDLPEAPRPAQQPRRDDNRRDDNRRDDRPQQQQPRRDDNRRRDDRPRDENRPRDDRPRDDRPRDENRPREENRPRDERPREERPRDDRPREENRREERPRTERPAVAAQAPQQTELPAFITGVPAAPVEAPVPAAEPAPKPARAPRAKKPVVAKDPAAEATE